MLLLLRYLRFLKIQKTWLFTFFCFASHVFSNYGRRYRGRETCSRWNDL